MKRYDYLNIVLAGFLAAIASLDVLGMWMRVLDRLTFWLWMASYLFFLWLVASLLIDMTRDILGRRALVAPLMMFALIATVTISALSDQNLSGETTIETSCALDHIQHSKDRGIREGCLFGYPTRQFYLSIVPSLLFGRSLAALHLGGSLYFVIGIIIFTGGALRFFRDSKDADLVIAILLSSIPHFYFVTHYLLYYGETIIPFDAALTLIGLYFLYRSEQKSTYLYFATLLGFYLAHSYIPGLAVWFLLVVGLGYLFVLPTTATRQRIVLALLLVASFSSLATSFGYRGDARFLPSGARTDDMLRSDVEIVLKNIVIGTEGLPTISRFYAPIFLTVVLSTLTFALSWKGVVVTLWMIVVLLISVLAKGYYYLGPVERLYRFNSIVPIFLSILAAILVKVRLERKRRYLIALFSYLLISGMYQFRVNLTTRGQRVQYPVLSWLKTGYIRMSSTSGVLITIGLDQQTGSLLGNINDFARYFFPEAQFVPITAGEHNDCTWLSQQVNVDLILLEESHPCFGVAVGNSAVTKEILSPLDLKIPFGITGNTHRLHAFKT